MGEQFGRERSIITVPFVSGTKQEDSAFSQGMGNLEIVKNAEYTERNSIRKRRGFYKDSETLYSNKLTRLADYKDTLLGFTNEGVVYQLTDNNTPINRTLTQSPPIGTYQIKLPELLNETTECIASLDRSVGDCDIAATDNYYITAEVMPSTATEDSYIDIIIKSRQNDVVVLHSRIAEENDEISNVRLCNSYDITDNLVIVVWNELGVLQNRIITLGTTPSISAVVYMETSVRASFEYDVPFDICSREGGGWYMAAISDTPSGKYLQIYHVRENGSVINSETLINGHEIYGISIVSTGTNGHIFTSAWIPAHTTLPGLWMWTNNTQTLDNQYGNRLTAGTPDPTKALPQVMSPMSDADFVMLYYTFSAEAAIDYPADGIVDNPIIYGTWAKVEFDLTMTNGLNQIRGLYPISKGIQSDNKNYGWFADYTNRINYLIEFTNPNGAVEVYHRVITTASFNRSWAGRAPKLYNVSYNLTDGSIITGSRYFLTALIGEDLNNPNEDYRIGFCKYESKNDTENLWQTEVVDNTLYISGGLLTQYDGIDFQENQFIQPPQIRIDTQDQQTTNTKEYGTYSYISLYEYIDANGLRHRSIPSQPQIVEVGKTALLTSFIFDGPDTDNIAEVMRAPTNLDYSHMHIVVISAGGLGTSEYDVYYDGGITKAYENLFIPLDGIVILNAYGENIQIRFSDTILLGFTDLYFPVMSGQTTEPIKTINIEFVAENSFIYRFITESEETFVYYKNGTDGYSVPDDLDDDGYFEFNTLGETPTGLKMRLNVDFTYPSGTQWQYNITNSTSATISLANNLQTYRYNNKSVLTTYRTVKNGEVYYRMPNWENIDDWTMLSGSLINNPIDTTFARSSFVDTTTDEEIQYHETLYSPPDGSGVLPNDHPWGGVKGIKYHRGRLWMISAEHPSTLFFTKEYEKGQALAYSLGQELQFDDKIVGLNSQKDYLVVFCERSVYIVSGAGPDATGDPRSGTFDLFKLDGIPGCTSARSIQPCSVGTIYHSYSNGFKLLTNSFSIVDIGNAILDYIDGSTTVLDSVYVDESDRQYVLYETNNVSYPITMINIGDVNGESPAAARFSLWKPTYTEDSFSASKTLFAFSNNRCWATEQWSAGGVPSHSSLYYLKNNAYLDGDGYVDLYIQTGFWNLADPTTGDAIKRCRKIQLTGYCDFEGITMTIYNSNYFRGEGGIDISSDSETWQWTAINDLKTYDVQLVHTNTFQQGRAFKVIIQSIGPNLIVDPGQLELVSLSFEVSGQKPGLRAGKFR